MRTRRSFLATSSRTPSSVPLRPILLASATASEYSSIGCSPVLPTISTTSCAPLAFSSATSCASSWSTWAALSVPVRSVTCRASCGTAAASSGSRRRITSVHRGRGRWRTGAEIHPGRGGDGLLVVHAEVRLDLVAEHLGGHVVGEGADHRVVLLHRLHVAVARHGDAVLGAFQLRLQVLEQAVGLQLRIVFADHHQPRQRAAQLALCG